MEGGDQPIGRGTWLALIAMGIAVFVIANDFSAINVAIPQIEEDFKTDVTTAQWVVNAYALTFGVLIVTGGRLADLFGRRRAGEHALVPPDVMRNRDFAYTCGAILLMSAVFFAAMLYLPQLMIKVLGYSPVGAGAGMLPMMATFACVSFAAGSLYERFGAKPLLIFGSGCIALGPALVALLVGYDAGVSEANYWGVVPGMAVLGLGIGLFYPTATTVGVTAVAESRRSLAGAIIYMFQIAGGSVGLGLTTAVFIEAGEGAATPDATFLDGLHAAFAMDAGIAVGGFLIATLLIGGRPHLHRRAHRILAGPSPRGHGP